MTNPITSTASSAIKTDQAPLPSTVWRNRSVTILKASAVALVVGVALTFAPLTLPLVAGASIIFAIGLAILSASGALGFAAVVSDKRAQTLAIGEWKQPFFQTTKQKETAERRRRIDQVIVAGNMAVAQSRFNQTKEETFGSYSTECSRETECSSTPPSNKRVLSPDALEQIRTLEERTKELKERLQTTQQTLDTAIRTKNEHRSKLRILSGNTSIYEAHFGQILSIEALERKRDVYLSDNREKYARQKQAIQLPFEESRDLDTQIREKKEELSRSLIDAFTQHINSTTKLNLESKYRLIQEFKESQVLSILESSEQQEKYSSSQNKAFSEAKKMRDDLFEILCNAQVQGDLDAVQIAAERMKKLEPLFYELKTKYEFSKKLNEQGPLQALLRNLRHTQTQAENTQKDIEQKMAQNNNLDRLRDLQEAEILRSFIIRDQEIQIKQLESDLDKICADIREIEKKILLIRSRAPQTPETDFLAPSSDRSDSPSIRRIVDGEDE